MPSFHVKSDHLSRLLLLLDITLLSLTYVLILRMYPLFGNDVSLDFLAHLGLLPVVLVTFVTGRRWFGAPSRLGTASMQVQIVCLLKQIAFTFFVIVSLVFLLKLEFVSRGVLLGSDRRSDRSGRRHPRGEQLRDGIRRSVSLDRTSH